MNQKKKKSWREEAYFSGSNETLEANRELHGTTSLLIIFMTDQDQDSKQTNETWNNNC